MSFVLLGFGLVLVIEGLVFALAPSRLDELVQAINALTRDQRRAIGLGAVGLGAVMVWLSQGG
ncbi:hypothetical protein XMM379_001464 [Aliiroseovarius sp. xm-m-379]|uniref:DUF2065 domain-containing protein n=1 Tax=Aliiroseovarius crassostreae TaxID=154981 RepID=A0A0P7KMB5_9RHOB|nr:DUF2065 domain-containing protein [Aliiroseovarius crassostreae]NRP12401.1 hypothetical protein [Aliiroseovarius sp. xm-d-517]NRP24775.1 hypothetical protein [Aliiroseovarius sp. xm-m-379]NRP30590.1 hypothetical protein [Aliiroseovarius sp. xm-m-314]NRP33574.1 hypothetical protein [Aliiroseovarius sp. xm-a-104]NRP40681.1 hypothetical protein [Aliiroseovarius sp. xm-m-339-2]NRP44504.1 hypothetical protein [Aliiroseovarius sp. xm-m-378]NRP50251.1 hypothetical protein [Aliiroseovarius sp. xm